MGENPLEAGGVGWDLLGADGGGGGGGGGLDLLEAGRKGVGEAWNPQEASGENEGCEPFWRPVAKAKAKAITGSDQPGSRQGDTGCDRTRPPIGNHWQMSIKPLIGKH